MQRTGLSGARTVTPRGKDAIGTGAETTAAGDEQAGRKPASSLHQRILGDIRERILSGEWPPGHRIPFEHELAASYACSRMTVNKALSQLAASGLIERRRKSGSFVRRPASQSAVLEIRDIGEEVRDLGLAYRFEITARARRKAAIADRERLDLAAPGPVLVLTCQHFAGARPFCLEERLINLAAVPEAAEADFLEEAPGPWLLHRVPWSSAEHRITAAAAEGPAAQALRLAPGTPCIVVERRTWSAEQTVTHVRLTYPGDTHALVARFGPGGGG
ncbi:histidine utilization repressor [Geminicoccaceae bacterium 1502E]|nr:histidine utilization repressor [Geminicoccaceae bacterium 1502E]